MFATTSLNCMFYMKYGSRSKLVTYKQVMNKEKGEIARGKELKWKSEMWFVD